MNKQRLAKIRAMLARRQPDLTICLEQVDKQHNLSAIIRTADAVGIHEIHAIWPSTRIRTLTSSSAGSKNWVQVTTHSDIVQAISQIKAQNMQVLAAHLTDNALDFRQVDYTRPTCILMGQEKQGVTPQAMALADQAILIPMLGMVPSLNVSVAAALILYEAQRQRQHAGGYASHVSRLPLQQQQRLLFEGGYPVLARVAQRKGLPYPHINQHGEIEADTAWWTQLQTRCP